MRRKLIWMAGAVVVAIAAGFVAYSFRNASRVLRQSTFDDGLQFTTVRLDRALPAGVESISSPADFRDAVEFNGRFYLADSGGLSSYDHDGLLLSRFRVGLELPAAPLAGMAVGIASGAAQPELWIATEGEGLLAFDGRQFRQIRTLAADGRKITAILPLSTGRILFGTEKKGLLVYDGTRIAPFHETLNDLHITALAGTDSNIWVGTLQQGVIHWRAGRVDRFSESEGLPDSQITSLVADGDSAFAGTSAGIGEFRDGRFLRVLAPGFFARSLLHHGESLTVGTVDEGVVDVPLGARPGRTVHWASSSSPVKKLLLLQGTMYCLSSDGLYAVNGAAKSLRPVLQRSSALLADRNISALSMDSAGRLWVGFFDRGLEIVEPGGEHSTHIENEHVFCVNRIVQDRAHGLTAVATANGLVMFDTAGKERQVMGPSEGLIANHVTDVVFRKDGMTLATPAGLTMIDAAGTNSLYAFHGLVNNHVYALAAKDGQTLAGTLGGLSVLDDGKIRASFTTANSGLKHNWITAIVPVAGEWFVGTYGAGVARFDGAKGWQTFSDLQKGLVINPNAMAVTPQGVYAGTLGSGLLVYNRMYGRWSAILDGLPSRNVTAIEPYGDFLYIGTDNGLVRVPERNLIHP